MSKALTADALEKFAELQKQFDAMVANRDYWKNAADKSQQEGRKLETRLEKLTRENEILRERIAKADAAEQQSKMDRFERDFYLKRGDELRSIISDICRCPLASVKNSESGSAS